MTKYRHPHMVIVPPAAHPDLIVGFNAVPGHLPQVLRWPGEPLSTFKDRALALATGRGKFLVTCIVREVPHAMAD